MSFSGSNDGIEWSLDFGAHSVILTVRDRIQKLTLSSEKTPLVARSLLLSEGHARLFEKPSGAISNYHQPKRDYGDEG